MGGGGNKQSAKPFLSRYGRTAPGPRARAVYIHYSHTADMPLQCNRATGSQLGCGWRLAVSMVVSRQAKWDVHICTLQAPLSFGTTANHPLQIREYRCGWQVPPRNVRCTAAYRISHIGGDACPCLAFRARCLDTPVLHPHVFVEPV
jgi:hypothetical protein